MNLAQLKTKLKKLTAQILGAIPSRLPVGVTEFDVFADSIIEIYSPACDRKSVRFIIATLIMRLNPTESHKSKLYFARCLHRGASGQISAHVMELIKQEQAAESRAAQELEATKSQGASNVLDIQK